MRSDHSPAFTRRAALAAGLSAAGALALGLGRGAAVAAAEPESASGPYGPFKMGLQSYSLRGIGMGGKPDLEASLSATKALGLHYWEAYPQHFPVATEAAAIDGYKKKLKDAGVRLVGYGVVSYQKPDDWRKAFEFAKAMGIDYLSVNPRRESFDALDKLTEEYGVNVGIHNHGPKSLWEKVDQIAGAIKDHSPRIGCCVDTGHFLRSREDPVRAVEVFGPRVYGVHLKDVKDATEFTLLGQGDLRLVDLLKTLVGQKYKYALNLEYEENPKAPLDDIRTCLRAVKDAVGKLKDA